MHSPDPLSASASITRTGTNKGAALPLSIRYLRLLRLALHVFWGLATVTFAYPLLPDVCRLWLKQRWSRQMLDMLGMRVSARIGDLPRGAMIVANHISWIDIFVINSLFPTAFIAKSDVRGWPLVGWLCAQTDTIFLRRGSRGHARIVNAEIAALLGKGKQIGLFPEGTTTDGSKVLGFHSALMQPAIEVAAPIVPLSVAYRDASGERSTAPAYIDDGTLVDSIKAIAAASKLEAMIATYAPIDSTSLPRRELASHTREVIVRGLGLPESPAANTPPETASVPADAPPTADRPTDSPNPAPAD